MRLIASSYSQNFVTSMTAFEVLDMGQTICVGLDGSYDSDFDTAFSALLIIYSPPPESVGVAIAAMEQAVRIYCPRYTSTWKTWAGREPRDPFE